MEFEDCICFQLGRSLKQVTKAYGNEIAAYKLTHGQFFLIVAIMEEEGLLPSEIAEKTAQDRAAVTGVLDRLEKFTEFISGKAGGISDMRILQECGHMPHKEKTNEVIRAVIQFISKYCMESMSYCSNH